MFNFLRRYKQCLDCGKIFKKPYTYDHNISDAWGSEEYKGCPKCQGRYKVLSKEEAFYSMPYNK